MNKNNYKTPLEQHIYETISKTDIISFEDIKDLFPKIRPTSLKKATASLYLKGYLYRLKRGLYLVTPTKKLVINDPLSIATMIYPSYLGFSTALRFYNLIEYEPLIIFSVTSVKSRTVDLGEYTFRYISMGARAIGATNIEGKWVSNPEKTFFDCFYKPQYAGGYESITKALYENNRLDWGGFKKYTIDLASAALCQRIGYILELLSSNTNMHVPKEFISYLKSRAHTPTRLLPAGPPHGNYNKEWKVLDNNGSDIILGWWFNG